MKSIFVTLLLFLFSSLAFAQTIVLPVTKVLHGEARYKAGSLDKPAVLILHGFLSTNNFSTVKAIETAVQETGASTLAITLTFDINQRKQSLKCNSIHTHTLQKDIKEIGKWVQWLKDQGHKEIVLIGHSFGSQKLLKYLSGKTDPSIKRALLTSMFYVHGQEVGTNRMETLHAQSLLKQQENEPNKFSYGFCQQNYVATPKSYLSYLELNRSNVLHLLENATSPVTLIFGEKDRTFNRVGEHWLLDLAKTPVKIVLIQNANHFFSDEYEFDLQDVIIDQMKQLENTLQDPIS